MAKLAYAQDLGSCAERLVGSSPTQRTILTGCSAVASASALGAESRGFDPHHPDH